MAEDRRDEDATGVEGAVKTATSDETDLDTPPAGEGDAVDETPAAAEADADTADNAGASDADSGDDAEALRAELEKAKDAVLRAQADAQNVKRRAEQDVEKARKFALERFASELLPVVDNLERALEAGGGDDEALRPVVEGVELTLKNMLDALRKFQIEPVDPTGEPFDPQLHQAMSMVENPDAEPNTVLTVMQKGYTLHGRLVRPAMVIVSKAPGGA